MALSTLPQLPSLSDAISGANALDAQANRYQGISDSFKEGQLTPLTAIAKGLSSAVASGKSEKAAAARDAAQARLNQIQELRSQMEQHQMEVKDRLLAEQEASATGEQLARTIDQASVGDDTGLRNWLASNPQSAKVMSRELGVPVESMTFSKLNGVDVLIPFGRDADGNMVTGQPKVVDDVLKAYAPAAYKARYKTRQENALTEAKIASEQAQAGKYNAEAEKAARPEEKPQRDWKEFEVTTGTYAKRIGDGRDQIVQMLNSGYQPPRAIKLEYINNPWAYAFLNDQDRQYLQSMRNVINATLRKESGAVISPEEFATARAQYIPTAEDSNDLANQKIGNINTVYEGFKQGSNGYVDELERRTAAQPTSQPSVKTGSNNLTGLETLPEGFKEIGNGLVQGPDGKKYRMQPR